MGFIVYLCLIGLNTMPFSLKCEKRMMALTYIIVSIKLVRFIIDVRGLVKPLWPGAAGRQPSWCSLAGRGRARFLSSRVHTQNSADAETNEDSLQEPSYLWSLCS